MIRIVLMIILYVVGPGLILFWAYSRLKHREKLKGLEIFLVLVAILLIGLFSYGLSSKGLI